MSGIKVRFFAHLRRLSGDSEINIEVSGGIRLKDFLKILGENLRSELKSELFDEGDRMRSGFLILVNDSEISALDGLNTRISNNDTVAILPFIHGG